MNRSDIIKPIKDMFWLFTIYCFLFYYRCALCMVVCLCLIQPHVRLLQFNKCYWHMHPTGFCNFYLSIYLSSHNIVCHLIEQVAHGQWRSSGYYVYHFSNCITYLFYHCLYAQTYVL